MPPKGKQKIRTPVKVKDKAITSGNNRLKNGVLSDLVNQQHQTSRARIGSLKQQMHSTRRSSQRLQNQSKNGTATSTPGKPLLADSAYDGDEESSPSSAQSEVDDPYSISALEDGPEPMVSATRQKKRAKAGSKGKAATKSNKFKKVAQKASTSEIAGHQSSTPNQPAQPVARRVTRSTPEVTPILPVHSVDSVSPGERIVATPQLYQMTPPASSISPSLQSSSQGDSGIVVSPPAKRARIISGAPRHKSAAILGKKFMNKRNIFSPNSKQNNSANSTNNPQQSKENMDSSCFGFDNSFSQGKVAAGLKRKLPTACATAVYRNVEPVLSDSSPTPPSQALTSTDSENWPGSSSQWPSPGLFSEDMFSADSESYTVNKSKVSTYKPSRVKKLKHKKSMSKFEAWALEKNMEIEDIEKFDLNIE